MTARSSSSGVLATVSRMPGPRGSRLIVDCAGGIPLAWFQIAMARDGAGDPLGAEGFTNHMAGLARRGAGGLDRRTLDQALDQLGASLHVSADRDTVKLSALCLARNLEPVVDLAADILARPRMDEDEHDRLIRETSQSLDEIRDDDSQLAARFFNLHCVPGHVYSRSLIGTEASLPRIELAAVRAAYRRMARPDNMIIGFAGSVSPDRAQILAQRLVAGLDPHPAPGDPSGASAPDGPEAEGGPDGPVMPPGRRLIVVDKPERTQSQILVGHLGPRYGTPESLAFTLIETIFGGMFTSRLMQEIRVRRGWSYGASCILLHSRAPHWFRVHLAPATETTAEALALVLDMLAKLAARGVTRQEYDLAQSYLRGSLPFRLATARQRVRIAIQSQLFGLDDDFVATLPERMASISRAEVNRVAGAWLHPADALSVVVAAVHEVEPMLANAAFGHPTVVRYDSY